MAGFDLDKQKSGTIPGAGRCEYGYYDISSGSFTVEVPTRLNTCWFGIGLADMDTGGDNNVLVFNTDCAITSGAVTFRRNSGYGAEDVTFRYFLAGW